MASSKSTVVGIRLDHERRAWVEAEAARLGVSMRGLFEGMIDQARSGATEEAGRAIAGLGSAAPPARPVSPSAEMAAPAAMEAPSTSGGQESVNGGLASSERPSAFSPRAGIGAVTALPTSLVREAFSLTASLIELTGRLATDRLESCVITKRRGRGSL